MAWTIRKKPKGLSRLRKRAAMAWGRHMHRMAQLGLRAKGPVKEAA